MKYTDISQTIGNTPVIHISRLFPNRNIWIKVERFNPGGSLKDRVAKHMIEQAELRGDIHKKSTIVEATSGNTGIALAMIGAIKGYRVILVMSKKMSPERVAVMKSFGAKIILTPAEKGTKGAVKKAEEIVKKIPYAWMPNQFSNKDCIDIHVNTTAKEIMADFPQGIDYIVTSSGTGAHITGIAKHLKKHMKSLKVYAVEPDISPVIAGGTPHAHAIAGAGPGFIPDNLQLRYIDGVIHVSEKQAFHATSTLAKKEGILAGISTGASLTAISRLYKQKQLSPKTCIVTFNYDLGERYLSNEQLFNT